MIVFPYIPVILSQIITQYFELLVKVEEKLLEKNYNNSRKFSFHLVSLRKHVAMNNEWLSEIINLL